MILPVEPRCRYAILFRIQTAKKARDSHATHSGVHRHARARGNHPSLMPYRLTVTIPGPVLPLERGKRFADPLDEALRAERLGELGDEGTQMGLVDGKSVVVAAEVELSVSDLDRALAVIRRVLRSAGAPPATTITQHAPDKVVHGVW